MVVPALRGAPVRGKLKRGRLSFVRQALTIASKDLRSELRTKEAINASLAFALVILLLYRQTPAEAASAAAAPGRDRGQPVAAGKEKNVSRRR